jgi:hypothetical protein
MRPNAPFIPDEVVARVGRLVNEIEDQLAAAQDDKRQAYADLREELKALGWGGAAISAEIAGFKAAIAEHRRSADDKATLEGREQRASHYLGILTGSRARARAHAREDEPLPPTDATQAADAPEASPDGASGSTVALDSAAAPNSEPVEGAPTPEPSSLQLDAPKLDEAAAPEPKRQPKYSDPPHPDCLNPAPPTGCGGFSNLGLCQRCREAAQLGHAA